MLRVRASAVLLALLLAFQLVGCDASTKEPSADGGISEEAQTLGKLLDVDTTTVPSGPTVGQLISVEDFREVLGRDDLTLAGAL